MPIVELEPGSRKRSMQSNNLWIRMCLRSKRTTTFFRLKSTTWLLNSKLMKSPCVPAGIISKCTTVDCEDYTLLAAGATECTTSDTKDGSRKMRLCRVKKFSISRWNDNSSIPTMQIGYFRVERSRETVMFISAQLQ